MGNACSLSERPLFFLALYDHHTIFNYWDWVRALPGDQGNIRHRLHTLEARGLMVIGRSPGGKAESVWLTLEGQKWASQLAGSCDEGENSAAAMG
jgi:hypothetical protein